MINGSPSPAAQNAIVAVYYDEATWATGILVAPNLVLTSKQLLFEPGPSESPGFVACNPQSRGSPIGPVRSPSDLLVMFGEKFPMSATARGVDIHSNGELDLCRDDVALLEIDAEFPIDPVPLRLDAPPREGESGRVVGWGLTDARSNSPPDSLPSLMGKRNQIELYIEKAGPASYVLPNDGVITVAENTFITDASGCYGDSGAPFLSTEFNAVVGTMTTFEPDDLTRELAWDVADCYGSRSTFRTLAPEREWLLRAFSKAGAVAWLEGRPKPAAVGRPCEIDQDCVSGRCLIANSGGFCTASCAETACASGQQCLTMADGQQWCVPERMEGAEQSSSSCGFGRDAGSSAPWALLYFLGLTLLLERARVRVERMHSRARTSRSQ